MKLNSDFKPLIEITLPNPQGRQLYMHTFSLRAPTVPKGFEDYLPVIEALAEACHDLGIKGKAHLTVDEKVVKAGMSQRRPKPHVDGSFIGPAGPSIIGYWGHGGGSGGWLHTCNNIPVSSLRRMAVVVAASEPGCRVWRGTFDGEPANDGDLSHIFSQLGEGEIVPANFGYLLSPDCVHESMLLEKDTPRTFLRIALEDREAFR